MNFLRLILSFVASCSLMQSSYAEEAKKTLNLQECWQIALENSPLIQASNQNILAAQENLGVVKSANYPDLFFISTYTRFRLHYYWPKALNFIPQFIKTPLTVIGPQDDWNMYFRSRYSIYDGGRTRAQIRGNTALVEAVAQDAQQVRQQTILNVALAFYGLMSDKKLYEVAQQNWVRLEKHVALAQERFGVGDAPQADVLQVKVASGDAKQFLVKSNSTIQMAIGDLNMAMGLPVETPLDIISVEQEPLKRPEEIDLATSMNNALCQRPEILAANERLKLAFSHIEEARSVFMPQLYAEGAYGWRNSHFLPHTKNWAVGVSMEMPLFQGYGDFHRLRESEALYAKELAEYDQLVLKVRQDVWNAYHRLEEAYEGVRQSQLQIVDAKENLRHAEERYRVGAATVKNLLDAEIGLAQSEAGLVQAEWTYRSNYELFLWTQGFLDVQIPD